MPNGAQGVDVETGTTTIRDQAHALEREQDALGVPKLSSGDQEPSSDTEGMPKEHREATEDVQPDEPKKMWGSSGLTPSQAASLRWERQRQREADDEAMYVHNRAGEAMVVRTSVETGKIIARLATDAKQGSTQAARELREWLNRVDIERDTDVSALDRDTRQRLKARLLAEISVDDDDDGMSAAAASASDDAIPSANHLQPSSD